jgi:hypothetical protein
MSQRSVEASPSQNIRVSKDARGYSMEASRPGGTAEAIALRRAFPLLVDNDPKIFADPLAIVFLGLEQADTLRATLRRIKLISYDHLKESFLTRLL